MKFVEGDVSVMLHVADMTKAELSRRLGVTGSCVSKWKTKMPFYVHSYLLLYIESLNLSEEDILAKLEGIDDG